MRNAGRAAEAHSLLGMPFPIEPYCVPAPDPSAADWNDDGVVILPGFLPEDLMTAYEQAWITAHGEMVGDRLIMHHPGGWDYPTPFRDVPALADLMCYGPLADVLGGLLGEPAGLHLNLTGWVSTKRNWHQDSYLNPPHVGDFYAAVWVALADIHPDSGPFQYVPGSHRWRQVTFDGIARFVDVANPDWPTVSENYLTDFFEAEIADNNGTVVDHLPKRGDVLIWHGRLLHRGSPPNVPGMERRAVISHFSGINHRHDMPSAERCGGGWAFPVYSNTTMGYPA